MCLDGRFVFDTETRVFIIFDFQVLNSATERDGDINISKTGKKSNEEVIRSKYRSCLTTFLIQC